MMIYFLIINLVMPVDIRFSPRELKVKPSGGYVRLELDGCLPSWDVARPELPVRAVTVEIGSGSLVNYQVSVINFNKIEGSYRVRPVPRPQILSLPRRPDPPPDQNIYNSPGPYPKEAIRFQGIHNFMGKRVAEFLIYPVRYYPRTGEIELMNRLVINLDIRPGNNVRAVDSVDYLIITNSSLRPQFQRLADWKRGLGYKTWIRDVSWITTHYPGRDSQEKIRNYIKTLSDSGIDYLLIGGDTDVVPCRFAYAMTCSAFYHPREDSLPCDLYYADLDGDWDRDNDGIFGEVEDSIDLYPDLIVGRAPVNTVSEAQAFVDKTITYEQSPNSGYVTKAMFAAEYLWPGTDSGLSKDKIGDESFPGYYNITKLYERLGNETPQAVINAIEQGQEFMNHNGHGWINVMSCGTGYLYNYHMDGLNNPGKFGIFYSIGCWTTAFDFDCIAEHFVFNPNGGGIGFIGNSSYGWGSPGNPTFGYSDRFDQRFYHEIFIVDHHRAGDALAYDKVHFIPYSREKNVYRWHQYQLNLLGDPSLRLYTIEPENLTVDIPDSLPVASSGVVVTVRDGNVPIEDAWVCLRKRGEWFSRVETDREGKAVLTFQFQTTGVCTVMTSAHNYLPAEKVISVFSSQFPNPVSYFYDDRLGNGDSIPNPLESLYLSLTVKNEGQEPTQDLILTLSINDTSFTVTDSIDSSGPLNPGQEVILTDAFQFDIGSVKNGYTGYFNLRIRSGSHQFLYKLPIQVGLPELEITQRRFLDPPPMPGDSDDVRIYLKNQGLGYAHHAYLKCSTSDPKLIIYKDSIDLGEIKPNGELMKDIPIGIIPSCPLGHVGVFLANFYADGYTGLDTVSFVVGQTGFVDSLESGAGSWTSGGTNNLWHLSEYRSHSPTHSFYCGSESNHKYINNMDCYIESDDIILDQDYELRFWRWFFVPIYGTDGLYVIIKNGSRSDTLDFIGTGGALGGRGIQGDWFEETYDLSRYHQGDTINLRFTFISDNDGRVGEGFYLDDIYIGPRLPGVGSRFSLKRSGVETRPSPFTDVLLITAPSPISEISIYNSLGQRVKNIEPDTRVISIETGDLPAGVYFIRIDHKDKVVTKKVVKIR